MAAPEAMVRITRDELNEIAEYVGIISASNYRAGQVLLSDTLEFIRERTVAQEQTADACVSVVVVDVVC